MVKSMSSNELRELYLNYFEQHGHVRIPSAPLVPVNDPSVLFTTAGMHPLVPYLLGTPHPSGPRLTNVQKSLRTTDIETVGDASHATVFEMLGNWSLGDYFIKEALQMSWEFLTGEAWLGLDSNRLAVSVFAGDADAPADSEAEETWRSLGVPSARIARLGKDSNWWPTGGGAPGPQGPDSEMFYWTGAGPVPVIFDPQDSHWVELWNDVFMQYVRSPAGAYEALAQKNVDTGMGLERVIMALAGLDSIYEIDTYRDIVAKIRGASKQIDLRHIRIVADHIKAATFVLADEHPVLPSKSEQGYVLRRLIRRAARSSRVLNITNAADVLVACLEDVVAIFGDIYPSLREHESRAKAALADELKKFDVALTQGLQQFDVLHGKLAGTTLPGDEVFRLYETYGFPIELTQELAAERQLTVDLGGFEQAVVAHQQASRTASAGKFKGGLIDHSQESIVYHTATHLLHQALRTVLGSHVVQRGSNITKERLRFDFSHPAKLSAAEIKAVEALVNEKIQADLPVTRQELSVPEAKETGALGLFEQKYADRVSVYSIGDFSREICGGPHVAHTGELGTFKIIKEESASSGIRRIKAVVQ